MTETPSSGSRRSTGIRLRSWCAYRVRRTNPHLQLMRRSTSARSKMGSISWRARLDGSNRRKVLSDPIIHIYAVSPDRNWVVVTEPSSGERSTLRTAARSADGSRAVVLCDNCAVRWSPDGKMMYFNFFFGADRNGQVVAVPTFPGRLFPILPPTGLTLNEAAKLPDAKRFDRFVRPSPVAGVIRVSKAGGATQHLSHPAAIAKPRHRI